MIILSLFDGISTGRVALDRAGIEVSNYNASEIDKTAIKISQANHNEIIQLGDINNLQSWSLPDIDLLIGGSPCQNFSRGATISNKERTGLNGDRSNLFWRYLEAKHKFNPTYFLLENVVMPKEHEQVITMALGVDPITMPINKSEPYQLKEYKRGRQARLDRLGKDQCPYGDTKRKRLWKAGYNDTDSKINERMNKVKGW